MGGKNAKAKPLHHGQHPHHHHHQQNNEQKGITIVKKVKKELPYDLTYFTYLGGIVLEENEEKLVTVKSTPNSTTWHPPDPPKPISDMTDEEKKDYEAKVEKSRQKFEMQQLMEKNLQQKTKQGDKPPEVPVKGGIIGKAKKKIQQTKEQVHAKAEEAMQPKETLEDRIKKQALAGAGGSLTGGATANLGQDIAKSQAIKDLEKKRREYEKQDQF